MQEIPANPDGRGLRVAVAVARFNPQITDMLLQGCLDALRAQGVEDGDILVARVPGAFELPLVCERIAAAGERDVVIALGAVIRGETAHFDFISAECARGLGQVALKHGCPVAFGVLTAENSEQARVRADPTGKNKGREAALAALETATLLRRLESGAHHA